MHRIFLTNIQLRDNMIVEKDTADRRLVHILIDYKITVQFAGWGGYFCDLLHPMEYPSPKEVRHKLMTAIRPTSVSIGIPSFQQIPVQVSM